MGSSISKQQSDIWIGNYEGKSLKPLETKSSPSKCNCRSNTLKGGQSFGRVGFCGACCQVWNPFKNKVHGTYST